MRFKLTAGLLSLAATVLLAAPPFVPGSTRQQQDEQDVIEGFVTTRGASFGDRKKPANANTSAAAQPKKTAKPGIGTSAKSTKSAKQGTGATTTASTNKASTNAAPAKSNAATTTAANAAPKNTTAQGGPNAGKNAEAPPADGGTAESSPEPAGAVGLGYTILSVGADGSNTVVNASRAFAAGDKIRIALETNADGFLYIFNAENDRPDPVMLYPHAVIDGGANSIAAHARDFFPADLRYTFEFDDAAATEHLYIIFSRSPLAGVPAGEALLEYCGATNRDECYWKPTPEQWARVRAAAAGGRVVESRNRDLAAAQTRLPPATLSRGIKVKKDEPAPSVVRMNASARSDVLLTKIELVHK